MSDRHSACISPGDYGFSWSRHVEIDAEANGVLFKSCYRESFTFLDWFWLPRSGLVDRESKGLPKHADQISP